MELNCDKKYIMRIINRIIFFILVSFPALGQNPFDKIKYQAESGIYLSTSGKTPFWLRSNQYGIVPLESQILTLRGSLNKEYDSTYTSSKRLNRFNYGYGIYAVVNVGKANQILLPEAYIKVRYGAIEFYGGRRKEIVGLVDTALTSGSYIWSGNALPMPKLQISIPNYTSIVGRGLVSIKLGFAHGWFNNGTVEKSYLHQKWIYGRIGKPNWKVKIYGGFNHHVQWGGNPKKPYIEKETGNLVNKYYSDFDTFIKVITGVSINKDFTGLETGFPQNEALNRAGNHLGTVDIATEINLKKVNLFIYRQSIYEDGSLFFLNNIRDGLLGISIKRKNAKRGINRICFEYIYTLNQGGKPEDQYDNIPQLRGNDNYFNNGIYIDGWTYKDYGLGTPLISSLNQIQESLINDKFAKNSGSYIINNRIKGYNISLSGKMSKIGFTTKLTWSNNLGSYESYFSAKQFSLLQQINYHLPKYILISSLSIDSGKLYNNNLGLYFGMRRLFF